MGGSNLGKRVGYFVYSNQAVGKMDGRKTGLEDDGKMYA